MKRYSWLAFLAGALTPLAFAPVGLFPLAVLMPAVLLYLWQGRGGSRTALTRTTPKQALWLGWLYGIGFFGVGISWVYISIHEFGHTPVVLAGIFTGMFVAFLALFPAIQGYIQARWFPKSDILIFPILWILFEWIRGWILTGFPWILIGYSQVSSPLNGLIPIVGEWGTGFAVILSSSLLVCMVTCCRGEKSFARKFAPGIGLILLWTISGLLAQVNWTTPVGRPISVVLTQGNIPQNLKWDQSYIDRTLDTYTGLTQPYWGSDLIIWPESAIPLPLRQAQEFVDDLSAEAKEEGTALLIGIPVEHATAGYYNSIHGLGNASGVYHKRHLVPFGEYVPLDSLLRGTIAFLNIPMSNFISGGAHQENLLIRGNIPVAPFICYEIAYDNIVRQHMPQAQLLVTISNVAWFGDSLAPWQHLEMGQFRALQTGRYHLMDGNAGITAVIDNKGRVQSRIPQFQMGVLKDVAQPMVGATPWVRFGDWPFWGLLLILLAICGLRCYSSGENNEKKQR